MLTDLGLGVAQIFTKKSLIDDELKKTGSGYKAGSQKPEFFVKWFLVR